MTITEKAKAYHEKMFLGYVSTFLETDSEFIERFDNFTFLEKGDTVIGTVRNTAKIESFMKLWIMNCPMKMLLIWRRHIQAHEVVGALSGNVKKTW